MRNRFYLTISWLVIGLLLAACGPTAVPAPSQPDTRTPWPPVPTSTSWVSPTSPTATPAPSDPLAEAQEALAAYVPVTDTQSVVTGLLATITRWLDAGGDPVALVPALTTTSDLGKAQATVIEVDLTGDGRNDVVVRIPVMGLPLLVFLNDSGSPARFEGYVLPHDLEAVQVEFPLEMSALDRPAVQLQDLTGDGVPEVLFTSIFVGGSNYRLRPRAFQWCEGEFRLIFAAELVSWAGTSDYTLEPDLTDKGRMQFVLSYPHLYNHGFDHKMINHPAGRQVWRWSTEAGRFVLVGARVNLECSGWGPETEITIEDRLRWFTNEGEAAFRAGEYETALRWYDDVLHLAGVEDWQREGQLPYWQAYAAFRRAQTLLLMGQPSGLPAMQAVAAKMEDDLLGDLAAAFLEGYGNGSNADAAARGVATMQQMDLYSHFYHERSGALRFPMDAGGILYPGAGVAAYLNAHPGLARNSTALRAGLLEIGFAVEEVTPVESGDLRVALRLPDMPYAHEDFVPWLFTCNEANWRVSLPYAREEWPTVGWFTP
jgi:hypothetical protein